MPVIGEDAAAAALVHRGQASGTGVRSREAASIVDTLLRTPPAQRRSWLHTLNENERTYIFAEVSREIGTVYGLWHDDPVGFGEDVLGETFWGTQKEVLAGIPHAKRLIVPAGFGLGKCVHCDDVIPLADGRMKKAADLVGTEFEVMAWREDGTQVRRRARAGWNAHETTYRVRTLSGREVVRNAAHPLWVARAVSAVKGGHAKGTITLTPEVKGWTPVAEIEVGDLVLVPEKHHAEGTKPVDPTYAKLVGYLLGDGGTSRPSQVTFTQKDGAALDEMRELVAAIGCELTPMSRPYHYRIRSAGPMIQRSNPNSPTGKSKWSPIVDLVKEWGLRGKTAREKHFPDWVWELPNEQLALVVGRLFACDAWVHYGETRGNRLNVQVAICLASERMIRDVEMAMLRFGITGHVRARTVTLEGKRFKAWEWSCRDRAALKLIGETISMPGKDEKLAELNAILAERSTARMLSWPHRNAPAGYRWDKVKEIEELPAADTVAIEVDQEHTFVTTMVEHNTHLAARATAWFVATAPVGRALCVTMAPRFRQVRNQLWPHIRRAHARAKLPGVCLQTEWQMPDQNGVDTKVAYGFSVPATDESAMQGIHAARLLLIVDEAGGLAKTVGNGTNNLLTGDARMLAIGNPPSDDPRSWFEEIAEEGELGDTPGTRTIPMPVPDNPHITGEDTPLCTDCTPNFDGHKIAYHLPDQDWVSRTIEAYGDDHPYVVAKVYAKFPKGGGNKAIPVTWVDAALDLPDPEDDDTYVRLVDLGLEGETATHKVAMGAWIRLGVDVAAAGGDEFVICRSIGDLLEERHASSGSENASAVDVAEKVLEEILQAQRLAVALRSDHNRIRVKIDVIGVGWGVFGMLQRWGPAEYGGTGRHDAILVPVNVAESPESIDEGAVMRPYRKRDELWLAGRALMQPDPATGEGRLRLRVERKTAAQFSTPDLSTNTTGYSIVEGKPSMKKRGLKSPDRAEAALLAIYEPIPLVARKRRGVLN